MNIRPLRFFFAACVPICIAIPGFATGVTPTRMIQPVGPVRQSVTPGLRIPRSGRAARSRSPLAGPAASGCTLNGPRSFVGISGGNAFDYAGGGNDGLGYAGVVAGEFNEACDHESAILTGEDNIIGGGDNDGANASIIGGGIDNQINGAYWGFIGAGAYNSLLSGSVYASARNAAVVAGYENGVSGPNSFIGAGLANVVAQSTLTTLFGETGQSAFIGAGSYNLVSGNYSAIVSGQSNSVAPDNSTVLGGQGNAIKGSSGGSSVSANSVIVGGVANQIATTASASNGQSAFIGAGSGNTVTANFASIVGGLNNSTVGLDSSIGGGFSNSIAAPASYATVAGGASNFVSGSWATIAGGSANSASGGTAAIGGGYVNTASGQYAAIPGGHNNIASGISAAIGGGATNTVSGEHATVPGGQSNIAAGTNSFAAGTSSNAANIGAFVWSDDAVGATVLKSTASNQFLVRASGGVHLYSSASLSSGVFLNAGSGTWSSLSDRNMKTNVVEIDPAAILSKVAALPVTEWSYRSEDPAVRHVGPMAQDFYATFGVGEDNRHITTIDEEGVALAAIKALQIEVAARNQQITELRDARHADEGRFASLEQRVELLEKSSQTATQRSGV